MIVPRAVKSRPPSVGMPEKGLAWRRNLLLSAPLKWGSACCVTLALHFGLYLLLTKQTPRALPEPEVIAAVLVEMPALAGSTNPAVEDGLLALPSAPVEPNITDGGGAYAQVPTQAEPPPAPPSEEPDSRLEIPLSPEPVPTDIVEPVSPVVVAPAMADESLQPKPSKKPAKRDHRNAQAVRSRAAAPAHPPASKAIRTDPSANASNSLGEIQTPAMASWRSEIRRRILKAKRYPREAHLRREEGSVRVGVTFDEAGAVVAVSLEQSSGFSALDKEAVDVMRRAGPFPEPPSGQSTRLLIPLNFNRP